MGNLRYDKDLRMFDKLTKFVKSTIIKDEKKALEMESNESVMNAAKFTSTLENSYTPTDADKLQYLKLAASEGYVFKVMDNAYIFKMLSEDERSTFTGARYVKDMYDEVTLDIILSNTALYKNVYVRTSSTLAGFIYNEIDLIAAPKYDRLFVKRKTSTIYKSINYAKSLEYSEIYKSNDDKKYMEIQNVSGTLNIFNGNELIYNKYASNVSGIYVDILIDNLKLPINTYYQESYIGSGEYIALESIQDVMNTPTTGLFHYNGASYINISRTELVLSGGVQYFYVIDFFDMDIDHAPYYDTNSIYLDNGTSTILLSEYITKEITDKYTNLFVHITDTTVLTYFKFENNTYDVAFDIEQQQPFDNSDNNITYLKKDVFCDSCFIDEYVSKTDTTNVTTYVCPSCGNIKTVDDMYLLKDIYMVTYIDGDVTKLICNISHNDVMIATHRRNGALVYKLEFVENFTNADRELNKYYIDLAKFNVDLVVARMYGDNHIIKYDNGILTNPELDKFIIMYYNTLRYFRDTMDNKALEIYGNYKNIKNFFVMVASINRFIDSDYKHVHTIENYTNRDARNMLYSHGIYEFDKIPLQYQLEILSNITSLLKKRGTDSGITEILNMFTGAKVNVFKYLMVKDYTRDGNGEIITPTIYTDAEIYDIINTGISDGSDYIATLDTILESRRATFNKKYNNIDIAVLKKNLNKYYDAFISSYQFDVDEEDAVNSTTIANIKEKYVKYFKSDIDPGENLSILNHLLLDKIISYYRDLSTKNTYNYTMDDFRMLFLNNNDILNGYDYFNDYKTTYNDLYKSAMIEFYGDMSDRSFKTVLLTEKENVTNSLLEGTSLDDTLFSHPYQNQIEFMLIVNLLRYAAMINDLDLISMRIIYENNNMELVNFNDNLESVKNVFMDNMYNNIKKEEFHKSIPTNFATWSGYISNNLTASDIYKLLQ